MLESKNLRFSYGTQAPSFSFPDLHCQAGQELLILGASGCGKTTLLHLLAGLLRPEAGQVKVANQDLQQLSDSEQDLFRGRQIGIVFQQSHVLKALSVVDNLLAAQYLAKRPQDRSKALALLERLNLGHRAQASAGQLSLGEQQRLAIARALINQPALVLADEPTSSLDDGNCREVSQLLLEQSRALNAALVIVTHDARLKEIIAQQVIL